MAHREKAPYVPQDVQEVAEMLRGLEGNKGRGKGKGGFSVKKHTFPVPGNESRTVDSWKMQDWDYKKPNLPTHARGLFTCKNSKGQPEIVVRGYDKFFNVEEVKTTEWRNIETNTRGPYELSVKENGCIIFLGGMDDDTLLVCSKHSVGPREDADLSHAVAGERWVEKQLASIGKTKQDLARTLREKNITAVAELCDDSFEEHVLAYNPESAGLYLHGINLNLPWFATYPGHFIDEFATEWGFKKTMYVMEDNIEKVKPFLADVGKTGSYAGRETEGFVIRCQARETKDTQWHDWFFKYKFEEPYLMYRQWRECTKAIIAGRPPRYKKHKKITEEYLTYARQQLAKNPQLAKQYNANHGIIAMRNGFLQARGLKGSDIIRQELESGEFTTKDVINNVVLIPAATIGCGKTTLAVALAKLFGWGHVQNDNIQGAKGRPAKFALGVTNAMSAHPVVIADRNNHQRRERKQIIEDVHKVVPDAHLVALHYEHDRGNYNQIRKAMQERVLKRGDNHQTIQAGSKSPGEIIGIMDGFLQRFEPVDRSGPPDDAFDLVIDLDVTASSRENLERVVAALHSEYPKLFDMPTSDDLDRAIEAALGDYKPDIKHDLSFGNKNKRSKTTHSNNHQSHQEYSRDNDTVGDTATNGKHKEPKLEYFCITLPSPRINAILDAVFKSETPETARFYHQLHKSRRIQPSFHVTLIHRASSTQHPQLWEKLCNRYFEARSALEDQSNGHGEEASKASPDPDLGTCRVQLERIVWDGRVMCIVARLLDADEEKGTVTTNEVAHITVGTAGPTIKPKESNDLLKRWLSEGNEDEKGVKEIAIRGQIILDRTVKAVLSR